MAEPSVTSLYTCAKQPNLGIWIRGKDQHIPAVYTESIYSHASLYALGLKKRDFCLHLAESVSGLLVVSAEASYKIHYEPPGH